MDTLIQQRPDVFIGIDAPDFNTGLELKLRRAGIRTVHYVSPSVWAWRQKRVLKIREACDLMLTLFLRSRVLRRPSGPGALRRSSAGRYHSAMCRPSSRAVGARFAGAGHDRRADAGQSGRRGGSPGELFLSAAERLRAMRPGIRFVMPCASPERRLQLEQMLATRDLPLTLLDGRSHEALAACNAVLIASGTATLEALLFKRPMVVAYSVAPMTYRILRRLVKALRCVAQSAGAAPAGAGAAAGRGDTGGVGQALSPLLDDGEVQTEGFDSIHRTLRCDASSQAADAVLRLVGAR